MPRRNVGDKVRFADDDLDSRCGKTATLTKFKGQYLCWEVWAFKMDDDGSEGYCTEWSFDDCPANMPKYEVEFIATGDSDPECFHWGFTPEELKKLYQNFPFNACIDKSWNYKGLVSVTPGIGTPIPEDCMFMRENCMHKIKMTFQKVGKKTLYTFEAEPIDGELDLLKHDGTDDDSNEKLFKELTAYFDGKAMR